MAPLRPPARALHVGESVGGQQPRISDSPLWPHVFGIVHPGSVGPDGSAMALVASATSAASALITKGVATLPQAASMLTVHRHDVNASHAHLLAHDDGNSTWSCCGGIQVGYLKEYDHPDDFAMMQSTDIDSWCVFFVIVAVLIFFDNIVLHRTHEPITFARASVYTVFWLLCAGAFNIYVYYARGAEDAWDWGTGYLLEWMLSVDNLFVFRTIFMAFKTPEAQRHKALFWGIAGAVVFRMAFFAVGEMLLHLFHWMTYILGAFLVYTGIKLLLVDDEDTDVEGNAVLHKISTMVPFVNKYSTTPQFFARIDNLAPGEPEQLWETPRTCLGSSPRDGTPPLRATRLLMVVIVLEATDIVFAVDSVSAIVAQIPDLFLAYTACVFAMLGLRATFFVVDELVKMFSFLSYAVSAMLVFIGLKLFFKSFVHFPPELVCAILLLTIFISVIASVIKERICPSEDSEEEDEVKKLEENDEEDINEDVSLRSPCPISERPENTSTAAALS